MSVEPHSRRSSATSSAAESPTGAAPAPIDAAALADCLAPLTRQRMLPGAAYTDPEVFVWESEHLFRRTWMCLGTSSEVIDPGSRRAVSVPGGSVLLVRGHDGVLRGFDNICRHRGHELLDTDTDTDTGTGASTATSRRAVVCPYHAWSYRLDGTLLSAPGYAADCLDRPSLGLFEVEVAEWHGWVFARPAGPGAGKAAGGDFDAHVGRLGQILAGYAPASTTTVVRHSYTVEANWKIIIENYNECYHCPLIHPELCRVSPPSLGGSYEPDGAWVGGWMMLADHAVTMSLSGASFPGANAAGPAARLPGVTGEDLRRVAYVALLPNVLISAHPDYVMTHRLTPLSPGATRVECSWAFPLSAVDQPGFDPSFAVDFWDLTNRQDWAACESVQRGVASPRYVPGPLSEEEDEVGAFVATIARAYLGSQLP